MGRRVRSWRIHMHVRDDLGELAEWVNPIVVGWMNYYGRF
jgi:RNA-directed DNA polymerase